MAKQGKKYYVISGADYSSKFVFEVKSNPQKQCGKPTSIYPMNYDSLYMDCLSEVFDMNTGRNLGRDQNGATEILQYLGPKQKGDFGPLYAHNPKLEGTQKVQTADPDNYLNIDYEMHLGTKIDYLFFQSSRILQATEKQLLQNQCEQERTQILTNLFLALENPREPSSGWLHAHRKSIDVSGNRWKPSLTVSLPEGPLASSHNESVL